MSESSTISARATAAALLNAVLQQRLTLDAALARQTMPTHPADVGFARALVLHVLRHLGQVDALLANYLDKPLPPKQVSVQHALRLGVVQLLLMEVPAHAAVHTTVELVKQSSGKALAGLVNAVLQKIAAEKPPLPSPGHNLPAWWGTRLDAHYGAGTARAIARVASERPPLDVQYAAPATFEHGARMDAQIWRMGADHPSVDTLEGYADGAFFVQDLAASYPARLLGDVRGQRVLDVCAAPGGKSMQLARAGAIVTALDRSATRLARLSENIVRLQLTVEIIEADALTWQSLPSYDAILLDAPCSATGTWRRHPEVVRLATPESIAELAQLQRQLMARAWTWLKPGGRMVYCTCSLEPEEGEQQAEWFRGTHADANIVPPSNPLAGSTPTQGRSSEARARQEHGIPAGCLTSEGYLRTRPDMLAEQGGMDGFFAVAFTKN